MKNAGVKIVTIDGVEYYDFSDPINKMVWNNAEEAEKHKDDFDMGLTWFASMINNNAPWDIKRQAQWNEQIGVEFSVRDENGEFNSFVLNGEVITPEILGNMTYGYWGTAMNYGSTLLFMGGGEAAVGVKKWLTSEPPYYGDSPEDHISIQKGIDWYNEAHQ